MIRGCRLQYVKEAEEALEGLPALVHWWMKVALQEIHLVLVAPVEVLMIPLHHFLAEDVDEPYAIRQAEEELEEEQLVAGWKAVVVPEILQEALSQRRLVTPSKNHLSKISSDTISTFPCSQPW